jgi:predicted helicase
MTFKDYRGELQKNLKSGQATEPTYYPALKVLLEAVDNSITVFVNPKKTHHGSPDFSIRRKKNVLDFPVGWIEAKEVGEDLDRVGKSDQLKHYLQLPNLVLTDFLEFRWYANGQQRLVARLGTARNRKLKIEPGGEDAVRDLLLGFLQHKVPPARDSRELARRMAQLAHFIRDAILLAYEGEVEGSGKLHKQLQVFRETLLPDLQPDEFADMYAQTIAYGLFAARCQPAPNGQQFARASAADLIPKTNPFLRKLFQEIAGVDLDDRIRPFVDDLVALLRETDIGAVLADFGKRTAKEDPVVHFYEDFLQAYDPKVREMRGVYYTPEPVVSYIVRSVDDLLKATFGKPMGLADKDVLILDPACGTGTFLYFVIRHVYNALVEQGQKGQWNSYVSESLLKRIFGFELLMAPYAVAHLKLGLLLKELGYRFEADERLGIYLTNSLEEAVRRSEQVFAFAEAIAEEGQAAAEVKREKKIMVVLGNPPYSGHSANRSWEIKLDQKTKKAKRVPTFIGQLLQDYYRVDGKPLGEKNPKWLQDDYVKFLRFAQWRIDRTGYGILAFITNHGYLDNPTFRGMRQQLREDFTEISLLNLHGNAKKKETAPGGSEDKNVFDIQQGVAIGLFVKEVDGRGPGSVRHADLWGSREDKYEFLYERDAGTTAWKQLDPQSPSYLFIPQEAELAREYGQGWKVTDVFPVSSVGVVTARDQLTLGWSPAEIWKTVQDFVSLPVEEAREKYELGKDTRDWKVRMAQDDLRGSGPTRGLVVPILYRPFDIRFTYYTGRSRGFLCMPRPDVMPHFLLGSNIGLITARSNKSVEMDHFYVTRHVVEAKCGESTTQSCVLPLYLYDREHPSGQGRFFRPSGHASEVNAPAQNINAKFLDELEMHLGFKPATEDVLHYAYAIFYAPSYRKRYLEFLRLDFPRVPLTSDRKLFTALLEKGRELVSLHLLESPSLSKFITRYEQPGDHIVEKVRYVESNPRAGLMSARVYINTKQYFEGVPIGVWEFCIGGYQVCEKWLKDRKGRELSSKEIDHYQRIVVSLNKTIRVMREIDELIPGWPLP